MSALPGTLEGVARRHLLAWVAELVGDGEGLTVLDTPTDELPVERLRAAANSGARVVVAVRDADLATAAAVAERIGATVAASQSLVHGSIIAGPGTAPPAVAPDSAGVYPWRVLLTANVDEADLARAASARLALSLESLHSEQLERLEAAYWSLRRANARLSRENLGRHDAAAATVASRLGREHEATTRQLQIEIEVGRRNDEYFQAARAKLNEPHHRAAEKLLELVRRLPGAQALSRKALPRDR
jgi:hypothetical protein